MLGIRSRYRARRLLSILRSCNRGRMVIRRLNSARKLCLLGALRDSRLLILALVLGNRTHRLLKDNLTFCNEQTSRSHKKPQTRSIQAHHGVLRRKREEARRERLVTNRSSGKADSLSAQGSRRETALSDRSSRSNAEKQCHCEGTGSNRMSDEVEIVHEPMPPPRASGLRMRGGCHIQIVDEATGKVASEVITPDYVYQNERCTRDERKY